MKTNSRRPRPKRLWLRIHQDVQYLFSNEGKTHFLQRKKGFPKFLLLLADNRNTKLQGSTGFDAKIQTGSKEKKKCCARKLAGLGCRSCQRRAWSVPYYAERRRSQPETEPGGAEKTSTRDWTRRSLWRERTAQCKSPTRRKTPLWNGISMYWLKQQCFGAAHTSATRNSALNLVQPRRACYSKKDSTGKLKQLKHAYVIPTFEKCNLL